MPRLKVRLQTQQVRDGKAFGAESGAVEARLVNSVARRQHLDFGFLLCEVLPSRHGSVTEEGNVMMRMLRLGSFRARSIYLSRVCWVSWREPINSEIARGGVASCPPVRVINYHQFSFSSIRIFSRQQSNSSSLSFIIDHEQNQINPNNDHTKASFGHITAKRTFKKFILLHEVIEFFFKSLIYSALLFF